MTRFRLPLLTLAFCAVAAAILAWDTPRRAAASIQAHRQEMEAYYAQAESHRSRAPIFDPPVPGNGWDGFLAALKEIYTSQRHQDYMLARKFTFSDAGAELAIQRPALDRLRASFRQTWSPPYESDELDEPAINVIQYLTRLAETLASNGRDRDAMNLLMLVSALAQDFTRAGEAQHAAIGYGFSWDAAEAGLRALDGHALGRADLESLRATLERLDGTWPGLALVFEWGRLYWKRRAFEVVLPRASLEEFYTWEDFGSPTLLQARVLGEIDLHHRKNVDRARQPSWTRILPTPDGPWDHAVIARHCSTHFCCATDVDYEREVQALESRTLLRVALALASHEAELGKLPRALQDLVPRYLKELPVSPLDGRSFGYADGTLISRDLKEKQLRWPVRRR